MSKVVGVRFEEKKGSRGSAKTYYYKTNKKVKVGDRLKIRVPSGGTPDVIVVNDNSKKKHGQKIKELKEVR